VNSPIRPCINYYSALRRWCR